MSKYKIEFHVAEVVKYNTYKTIEADSLEDAEKKAQQIANDYYRYDMDDYGCINMSHKDYIEREDAKVGVFKISKKEDELPKVSENEDELLKETIAAYNLMCIAALDSLELSKYPDIVMYKIVSIEPSVIDADNNILKYDIIYQDSYDNHKIKTKTITIDMLTEHLKHWKNLQLLLKGETNGTIL